MKSLFPYRKVFGHDELAMVKKVFQNSWKRKLDFGYQEEFEESFTKKFIKFQGSGYCDAVNSGTNAIWLALKALNIKNKKKIAIVSPVTNPGSLSALSLENFKIKIVDSEPNSFSISNQKFKESLDKNVKVAVITHYAGLPIDLSEIRKICKQKKIYLIEDCSQGPGAEINGKKIGNFGDIAIFSTGYRKNLATGGNGGLIYTKNKNFYWLARSYADRGKPFHDKNFNQRDFHKYEYPGLNMNLDELSCAIGISILKKLPSIINKRYYIAKKIKENLNKKSQIFSVANFSTNIYPSVYFLIIKIDLKFSKFNREKIKNILQANGLEFNPKHREVVSEWKWIKAYLVGSKSTPNALKYRNESFNLYLNEKYNNQNINQILQILMSVEKKCLKLK